MKEQAITKEKWTEIRNLLESAVSPAENEVFLKPLELSTTVADEGVVFLRHSVFVSRAMTSFLDKQYGPLLRNTIEKSTNLRLMPIILPAKDSKKKDDSSNDKRTYYIIRLRGQDFLKRGTLIWASEDNPAALLNAFMRGDLIKVLTDVTFDEAYLYCSQNKAVYPGEDMEWRKIMVRDILHFCKVNCSEQAVSLIAEKSPLDMGRLKKALLKSFSDNLLVKMLTDEEAAALVEKAKKEAFAAGNQMKMNVNHKTNELEIVEEESTGTDDGWMIDD